VNSCRSVEDYTLALQQHLTEHGPCRLDGLGLAVKRFPGIRGVRKFLEQHKDFHVDAAGMVSLSPPQGKKAAASKAKGRAGRLRRMHVPVHEL
jgi:hypothetical protein